MPQEHDAPGDVSHAYQAISQFAGWINNADAKSAVLAAAAALVLGGYSQQVDAVRVALRADTPLERVALGLLAGTLIATVVTFVALGVAVFPRFEETPTRSRFSYPYVARTELVKVRAGGDGAAADEAWTQAARLATIALRKFQAFRVALVSFGVTLVLFLIWTGIAALITT